jgi:hypothetical protein
VSAVPRKRAQLVDSPFLLLDEARGDTDALLNRLEQTRLQRVVESSRPTLPHKRSRPRLSSSTPPASKSAEQEMQTQQRKHKHTTNSAVIPPIPSLFAFRYSHLRPTWSEDSQYTTGNFEPHASKSQVGCPEQTNAMLATQRPLTLSPLLKQGCEWKWRVLGPTKSSISGPAPPLRSGYGTNSMLGALYIDLL